VNDASSEEQLKRKKQAFATSCGALSIGATPESMREDEIERLEWEAWRARGGQRPHRERAIEERLPEG
jgi:hypothetical protein